jgi:hypothetical protein
VEIVAEQVGEVAMVAEPISGQAYLEFIVAVLAFAAIGLAPGARGS